MSSNNNKKLKTKAWSRSDVIDGIIEIKCRGWPSFEEFLHNNMVNYPDYIWRGQRCSNWTLAPSLDRILKELNKLNDDKIRSNILQRFKFASRGRLETITRSIKSENEWWALGRHFGLATPLLDWTFSPYIAAFFACENKGGKTQTKYRVVYGLSTRLVNKKSRFLNKHSKDNVDGIKFITPLTDDNPRLINQRCLFTRSPNGIDIENWVKSYFKGRKDQWVLIKILIPNSIRDMFLRSLERMAISPLELFPDLTGATKYCNLSLEVKNYCQKLVDTDIFEL